MNKDMMRKHYETVPKETLINILIASREQIERLNKARKFDVEYNKNLQKEIIRLNNIIKQQDTRNSRQRVANKKLQEENNFLKQLIPNEKKYSYGIRMGSDKE